MTDTVDERLAKLRAEEERLKGEAVAEFLAAPSQARADAIMLRFSESEQRANDVLGFLPYLYPDPASPSAWQWIAGHWPGFDLIPHPRYERMFRTYRRGWSPGCMCPASRAVYDALPTTFVAYRGQDRSAPIGVDFR